MSSAGLSVQMHIHTCAHTGRHTPPHTQYQQGPQQDKPKDRGNAKFVREKMRWGSQLKLDAEVMLEIFV